MIAQNPLLTKGKIHKGRVQLIKSKMNHIKQTNLMHVGNGIKK